MSIIARARKCLNQKNYFIKDVVTISLEEDKATLLCEDVDKKEMQLWHSIHVIEKSGRLETYSEEQKIEYESKRNFLSNIAKDFIERVQFEAGVIDVLVPLDEEQIKKFSDFFQSKQNIDCPQEYFFYDWQEEEYFGRDILIRTECLEPLEQIQTYEKLKEETIIHNNTRHGNPLFLNRGMSVVLSKIIIFYVDIHL